MSYKYVDNAGYDSNQDIKKLKDNKHEDGRLVYTPCTRCTESLWNAICADIRRCSATIVVTETVYR